MLLPRTMRHNTCRRLRLPVLLFTVSLLQVVTAACPNNCSGNSKGRCINNECECREGWEGVCMAFVLWHFAPDCYTARCGTSGSPRVTFQHTQMHVERLFCFCDTNKHKLQRLLLLLHLACGVHHNCCRCTRVLSPCGAVSAWHFETTMRKRSVSVFGHITCCLHL